MESVTTSKHYETSVDIIAAAQASRLNVSNRKLVRWQNQGLIPRPKLFYPKGKVGSVTGYPQGTIHQVIVLGVISLVHKKAKDRGWYLWLLGFHVDGKYWEPYFRNTALQNDKCLSLISAQYELPGEITDRADKMLERLTKGKIHHPFLGPLKRKLGYKRLHPFLATVIQTALGYFRPWDSEKKRWDSYYFADRQIHADALGLTDSTDQEFYGEFMSWIANKFADTTFGDLLKSVDASELHKVAIEFSILKQIPQTIADIAEARVTGKPYLLAVNFPGKRQQATDILAWIMGRQYPPNQQKLAELMSNFLNSTRHS